MPPTFSNLCGHFRRVAYPIFSGGLPPGSNRPPVLPSPWMPRPSDPVFLLLYPSKDAARQMVGLASRLGDRYSLRHQPTEQDRLHSTQYFVDCFENVTPGRFAEIDQVVSRLTMPPFVACYDRAMKFGKTKGNLVLCGDEGITGVRMLHDELATAMRMIGFRYWERNFTPHITLNYGECAVPAQPVEGISWIVDELFLVCSAYGRSKHLVLGRWRLQTPVRFH